MRSIPRLVLIAILAQALVALAGEGDTATAKLAARLAGVQTFHGTFIQFTQSARGEMMQQVEGSVWVERPNRFRWQADPPQSQQIVSDGVHTWSYDADLEQVIKRDFDPEISRTPLMLLGSDPAGLDAGFVVTLDQRDSEARFTLSPRAEDALFEMLEIHFSGDDLVAIRMFDTLGQRTHVEFTESEFNRPIDAALFTFELPEGVDLIEDTRTAP